MIPWSRHWACFSFLRSIHLAYVEDVEVKGIQAYRFAPPSDVLMNPKDNPTNAGFCVPAGDCLGTGVLKVSVCREGMGLPRSPPQLAQSLTQLPTTPSFPLMTPNQPCDTVSSPPISTPQKCPFSQKPCPLPGIWQSHCLSMPHFLLSSRFND